MSYELTDLKYFYNVATTLSFARGAQLSHVSAPAISKSVKRLEESLGHALFQRTTRSVRLTGPGEVLLETAREIFSQLDDLQEEFDRRAKLVRGDLRIGATEVFAAFALPQTLSKLTRQHADVSPRVYSMSPEAMKKRLLAGTIDIGLCAIPKGQPIDLGRGLECEALITSPASLVCGATHPLYATHTLGKAELESHPFVVTEFFERHTLAPLDSFPQTSYPRTIGATVELLSMAIQLVVEGAFLGYFPNVAIRCQLNHDELRVVGGLDLDTTFELCALTRNGETDRAVCGVFLSMLTQSLREALNLECAPL